MSDSPQPYRVLARKYRPQNFRELIGQDAMVQTLGNAIKRGRLAHAFLMTGVRGVGKTSTARLVAKALNCIGPDGNAGPTIDPCGVCEFCVSIAAGRHPDVIEMDAASHTGVDDIRSVINISRNTGFGARYQIFIIDEVHMLSRSAFNALLKTLEEPPENVKFLFATTEVDKVPVTVMSRCQRFDLRRISVEKLAAHFQYVAKAENVRADLDALTLIAQAAEGSARDGLSILDQAIAHADNIAGEAVVTVSQVRDMLGLADRGAIRRLLGTLFEGEAQQLLAAVKEQHDLGTEPLSLMRGLLEIVHAITVAKAGRGSDDPGQSAEEREALADWASQLGFAALHRLWQLLLKGHDEVANAALPMEACEMALLRAVHAASLPDPSELARMLRDGGPAIGGAPSGPAEPAARAAPETFAQLVEQIRQGGGAIVATTLHDEVGLVRYAPPLLAIRPLAPLAPNFIDSLRTRLTALNGAQWKVEISDGPADPSLWDQEKSNKASVRQAILDTPVVAAAMAAFPEAELLDVNPAEQWSVNR